MELVWEGVAPKIEHMSRLSKSPELEVRPNKHSQNKSTRWQKNSIYPLVLSCKPFPSLPLNAPILKKMTTDASLLSSAIYNGDSADMNPLVSEPIVQVLSIKKVVSSGQGVDRYRCVTFALSTSCSSHVCHHLEPRGGGGGGGGEGIASLTLVFYVIE